jgi:SPP1 gp7 family putative phage head morphogenesis protein
MKKSHWEIKKRVESDYAKSVQHLFNLFFSEGEEVIERLAGFLSSPEAKEKFDKYAESTASRMVTGIYTEKQKTWQAAARKGMQGQMIHGALSHELGGHVGVEVNQLVQRNARLIKSLPLQAAQDLNAYITKLAMEGKRADEIADMAKGKAEQLTSSRIMLIARTETSKAGTALNRARSEELSLDWYVWRTDKDGRVRSSHRIMEGVIVNWNEAPNPEQLMGMNKTNGHYHAGEIFNCRCYTEPLLDLDQVSWPHRVYTNGTIKMLRRSQFAQISNMQIAA